MVEENPKIVETTWYEAELANPGMTTTEKAPTLESLESCVFGVRKNLQGEVIEQPKEIRIYAVHEVKRLLYVRKK